MSLERLPGWLHPVWQDLSRRDARLPHAMLFCGPAGSGKRLFAEHLVRALLCESRDADGFACGHCQDCTWIESGNHPDYFRLVPAADEMGDEDDGETTETTKKEKSKSTQIVIDQVRALQSDLEVGAGGHAGGRRLVIIDPAEAMNQAASNALLKALEEPNGNTVYLLLSNAPRRLLATILSRCQRVDFPRPDSATALQWMQAQGIGNAAALLGFASGLPLAARSFAIGPLADARSQLAKDLGMLGSRDPLKLAAEWESRLKAKGASDVGLNMAIFIDWLERWLSDGVRVAQGRHPRFFADHEMNLEKLAGNKASVWLDAYREVQSQRPVAMHPLNPRLFLEDLLLRVFRWTAIR
jgi:DNA polymerase III subunit delta'